ncbi:response regulator [Anaerolineales bacterium HSG24]|nr:response regulator [Anaerolineales bacterium HSG24]
MEKNKEISTIRLLLVEDLPSYSHELKEWLTIFGYQHIEEAVSAAEAEEKLDTPYDVIISDMRMEENTSGFTVLEEIKRRNISSIVIILTANDNVRHCRDAFKLGVTDYISKNWRDNIFAMVDKSFQTNTLHF